MISNDPGELLNIALCLNRYTVAYLSLIFLLVFLSFSLYMVIKYCDLLF